MSLKEKVGDFIESARGPVLDIVSDLVVPSVAKDVAGHYLAPMIAQGIGEVAGALVPGVGNMVLSYKQRRFERNIEAAIEELIARQDEFNEHILQLETQTAETIKTVYFGIMLDHASVVTQEEKIKYIVSGYINIAKMGNPQEDVVMMYYDTLDELSMLDLRCFRLFKFDPSRAESDDMFAVREEYSIGMDETRLIYDKLNRLGLIETRREGDYNKLYDNVNAIIDYLGKVQKKDSAKLNAEKLRANKNNRIITAFGSKFFDFFLQ